MPELPHLTDTISYATETGGNTDAPVPAAPLCLRPA